MHTSPLQRRVNPLELPLDQLARSSSLPETEKCRAAARAFEAIFLRQILESAQKTLIPSTVNTESAAKAIHRDLTTSQLADAIARSGQFGLARSFEAQWRSPAQPAPQS